ncbi:MAG: hypothetical protein ACKVK0_09745 [Pirellulales bacterium]
MAKNKMQLNVYTMMLVLSFMAVTVSTVLLWLEWEKWQTQV